MNRALAILLPSVTLLAHLGIFAVLQAVFAESWGSSFVATYDLVAAAASAIGLMGALQVCTHFGERLRARTLSSWLRPLLTLGQRRRVLLATYLIAHTITLSLISAVLLVNILPTAFTAHFPFSSQVRYDTTFGRRLCQELDSGFGSDETWLRDCAASLNELTRAAMWLSVVLMAAQWMVLMCIGNWVRDKPSRTQHDYDVEKGSKLGIRQDYKG